ncbi:hypothetical protein D3C80_1567960 [compost metagenome]
MPSQVEARDLAVTQQNSVTGRGVFKKLLPHPHRQIGELLAQGRDIASGGAIVIFVKPIK